MTVDEARQHGRALDVDDPGPGPGVGERLVVAADEDDLATADHDRFRIGRPATVGVGRIRSQAAVGRGIGPAHGVDPAPRDDQVTGGGRRPLGTRPGRRRVRCSALLCAGAEQRNEDHRHDQPPCAAPERAFVVHAFPPVKHLLRLRLWQEMRRRGDRRPETRTPPQPEEGCGGVSTCAGAPPQGRAISARRSASPNAAPDPCNPRSGG